MYLFERFFEKLALPTLNIRCCEMCDVLAHEKKLCIILKKSSRVYKITATLHLTLG